MSIFTKIDCQSCMYIRKLSIALFVVANESFVNQSKFKLPAGLSQPNKPTPRDDRSGLTHNLSPFAKMVLNGTKIAFNCKKARSACLG